MFSLRTKIILAVDAVLFIGITMIAACAAFDRLDPVSPQAKTSTQCDQYLEEKCDVEHPDSPSWCCNGLLEWHCNVAANPARCEWTGGDETSKARKDAGAHE